MITRLTSSPSYTLYHRLSRVGLARPLDTLIPFVPDFYVSPTGGTGSGSISDPWSLSYAIGRGVGSAQGDGKLIAGKKIAMLGGIYSGTYITYLAGTPDAVIILRQYPGQRAIIDGNLILHGTYAWYWGFEVMSSILSPQDLTGVAADGIGGGTGIKFINMVVHDCGGNGFGTQDATADIDVYGCLIYNNGRQRVIGGFAHGIYVQSDTGIKTISDNFIFDNLGYDIHGYSEQSKVNHLRILFNVGINTHIGGNGDWLIGRSGIVGTGVMMDELVKGNMIYGSQTNSVITTGPEAGHTGDDLIFIDNYIWGALVQYRRWANLTVTGNIHASQDVVIRLYTGASYPTSPTYVIDNNTFFDSNTQSYQPEFDTWLNEVGQPLMNFAAWRATTGYDLTSTLTTSVSGKPTVNVVFVRPNIYEAKRANIIIYNWQLLPSVNIDVSSILSVGDAYEVRNVQDYFGSPIVSDVYTGGNISIPMTAITPPVPIGGWPGGAPPATGPEFNAFVLKLQGS